MSLIPDPDLIEEALSALPVTEFQAGEVVLLAGSRSEQLLFLKKGAVAVVKDGIEIARVTQPGAVLGELSVLLNQPHSADVRAAEAAQVYVASPYILSREPLVLFYVAEILARRLNATNQVLVELKTQIKAGQGGAVVEKTIEKIEGLLGGVLRLPTESFGRGSALVNRAETFLANHPKAEHQLRRIFALKLANVRESEEPTRRRAPRSEFTEGNGSWSKSYATIPTGFVTATPKGGETYVEVPHEIIFRRWRKLRDWIDAERDFLAWKTELEAARRGWKDARDVTKNNALLKGASLAVAKNWQATRGDDLPAVDREFIDQSVKRDDQVNAQARHLRVFGYVALLGIVAGAVAWINKSYLRERWYRYTQFQPYVLSVPAARALKPGDTFRECAEYCPEMVVVPAGEFMMGAGATEEGRTDSESPQHKVTIAAPFAVSKFEVTFDEWNACVNYGDCDPKILADGVDRGHRPVVKVSWYDAQRYVAWLSKMTGKPYRLLSEAEWEYAARAGTQTPYPWGNEIGKNNANCLGCGSEWDGDQSAPVGSFAANAFGLHDMLGNVSEWVEDCYRPSYVGAPPNGAAWITGGDCTTRVIRGGGWNIDPVNLRSASRGRGKTFIQFDSLGFRVARTLTR